MRNAWHELGQTLTRLDSAARDEQLPLRYRRRAEVELELEDWTKAAREAHDRLSGELSDSRNKFENSTVKVVAHSMRLALHLGRTRDAAELDRAFFSAQHQLDDSTHDPEPPPKPHAITTTHTNHPPTPPQSFHGLPSLALRRGRNRQAWLTSLALRLRADAFPCLSAFLAILKQLRLQLQHEGNSLAPTSLAALARMADRLAFRLEHEGLVEPGEGRETATRLLLNVAGDEAVAQEPVVLKAVAETELTWLEEAEDFGAAEWARWRQLAGIARRLLAAQTESRQAGVDDLGDTGDSSRQVAEESDFERQAEVLHIGIRFLLLQARLRHDPATANSPHTASLRPALKSVSSALALHYTLNDLTPHALDSPGQLIQLRTKQAATLYRLLWASVYSFDLGHTADPDQAEREDLAATELGWRAVNRVHGLLESALAVATSLPAPAKGSAADSRVLGVSSRFFRRLLYSQTLPSAPSRRAPPRPPAIRPPWTALERSLSLILQHRQHDAFCLSSHSASNSTRLLNRSSIIINLIRATLLGGSDGAPGEGSPESRLAFLLSWLGRLDELPGERVDRSAVRAAVKEVVKRELKGEVWSVRREGLRAMVKEWVKEHERKVSWGGRQIS